MAYLLVIDDEESLRDLMVQILREEGYVVEGAGPVEALTMALRDPPMLLLMDMMMPGMDGAALRGEMTKHAELAAIPFIIVTAWHDPERWFGGLQPASILSKPFGLPELVACVKAALATTAPPTHAPRARKRAPRKRGRP